MDFRSLEVFVWVANLGSFRGAAARLNTTQPAVSQRIAQLERDLGVRLLERSRTGVVLTERGRVLLGGAERVLGSVAALREEVGDSDATRGSLRLGVAETIVHTWLPRFLERVARSYPALAIEIEVDVTPSLTERLLARQIDLAFVLGEVTHSDVRNLPLCRFPVAFLAAPGFARRSYRRADLADRTLITFSRPTRPYADLTAAIAGIEPRPRIHASASLATVIRMAVDGLGIAAVPTSIAAREITDGSLAPVEVELEMPDLVFVASWPSGPTPFLAETVAAVAAEVAAGWGRRTP
ncbi:LysR family transcriptional regulator [Enterovirga rhinocerotis]|uniref:LysR family transcriptional regulator n=1 Tax=Enterovirga rhinocerotis TaxID=1339210 RepID=UPI001FDF44A9|nr:LysR family transcriptional regulator [Enterovirga rhinocerotis]